ncbi:MAG: anaerobic ribonucleoside-triphosphate reductase activating protein [Bacteroidetes bacterium]|nr:anaerobic ribonucleoside-triphosphate reductase activating protein [Bacteroidota bacterium]
MNYYKSDIVLQEVPDEISLCFSICGCPLRCEGCHSPFLWKSDGGSELNETVFCSELNKYTGLITCVLFMGGEWDADNLVSFLKIARNRNLKTCLYTGLTQVNPEIKNQLTYLKTGPWIATKGGLDSPATNQVFTDVKSTKNLNHLFKKRNYDTTDN